jgi:hypothetical protein
MEVVIKVAMDDQTLRQTMDLIVAKKLTPAQEQQLAAALDAEPQIVEIVGNMGTQLQRDRIASMAKQPGYEMVMQRKVKAMRAELKSAEASPAERLVIDSVITCWLDLQWMQNGYQHFWTKGGTTQQAELWERRLSAAHSRFLKQVEALAKLRYLSSRMQRVQINVAQNQVVANG